LTARARRGRFQRFESAVRVTDVDRCAAYIQEAETYSRMNDSRPQTIWPVQNAMVKCAFEGIVELAAAERWDVGNTFVLFSDLDELPSADTLLHIKHCEPRDPSLSSFGLELTTIAYNLRGATATLCASPPRAAIVPVQVTSMQQIVARQFPNRHPQPAANRLMRRAGVHLTQFGGGVISDFKGLTHGEGGGWNPIVVSNKDGANVFCTVSDAELCLREQLSVDQPHLVVRFWERGAAVPPLPAMRAARELVAQCGVPWALAFNEQRFAPHHGINVNIISNTFENRN
jgi:hypothetical protein